MRPPAQVMRLERMGAAWATRLSFSRQLIRRMCNEQWQITRTQFDINAQGVGRVQYRANTGRRVYTLVGFSHPITDSAQRNDRVVANVWDSSYVLFDGTPTAADVTRLAANAPRQEAGRFTARELVLTRANKSVRAFDWVVSHLTQAKPIDDAMLLRVGYLMRTTAVYGNGKFGIADRSKYKDRAELRAPFQAEMLAVYLIRLFTLDLAEHLARCRAPQTAAVFTPAQKQFLGVGNATGLGMAPFLTHHPRLIHRWVHARETAAARVFAQPAAADAVTRLGGWLSRVRLHICQWSPTDVDALLTNCDYILAQLQQIDSEKSWHAVVDEWSPALSTAGQELLISGLLELYPELVDAAAEMMSDDADDEAFYDPHLPLADLREQITTAFSWLERVGDGADDWHYFWYYAVEKMEPRLGARHEQNGADKEMPLAVAHAFRQLQQTAEQFLQQNKNATVAQFLRQHPQHRPLVVRVQMAAAYPYGEIQDNLVAAGMRPLDLLRFKLAFFGATKFDPQSDLWLRINLFQAAPLPHQLTPQHADNWHFPVLV